MSLITAVANKLLVGQSRTWASQRWAVGGSYHVLRLIRMFIEFWDRVSLHEQETMIGRYRVRTALRSECRPRPIFPTMPNDPSGKKIPLTAHIRLVNPRVTAKTADSRILPSRLQLRQRHGSRPGNLNIGLIFNCFQQDLDASVRR
jgi:deferrochelatase/peroxidase EfeB